MVAWLEARDDAAQELVAGAPAKGEYRCTGCGYGVTVYRKLPRCPMCGEEDAWERLGGFGPLGGFFDEPPPVL